MKIGIAPRAQKPASTHGADTLFARLAVLVVLGLLVPHLIWFVLARIERSEMQSRAAVDDTLFLIESVQQHLAQRPQQPLPRHIRTAEVGSARIAAASDWAAVESTVPPSIRRFHDAVAARVVANTELKLEMSTRPPLLWVRPPRSQTWFGVPVQQPPRPPSQARTLLWLGLSFCVAVLLALFAAWRLQRPLHALAAATARVGRGRPVSPLPEDGVREVRQLTRAFNQMVSDIARAESDRNVMLAGVAHDLKAPLARMRVRAELLDDVRRRDGFVRDVDSLTRIVDQFLVYAHESDDMSSLTGVDAYCERYVANLLSHAPLAEAETDTSGSPRAASVVPELALAAGPEFELSSTTLERLLSNLVGNALAYGEPPVTIRTWGDEAGWHLEVADRGPGIPESLLDDAQRPFVRLDPARSGIAHCGLGLAIVDRLARRARGRCVLANRAGGGLRVELVFARGA